MAEDTEDGLDAPAGLPQRVGCDDTYEKNTGLTLDWTSGPPSSGVGHVADAPSCLKTYPLDVVTAGVCGEWDCVKMD